MTSLDRRALRKSLRTDLDPGLKTRAKRAVFRLRQASHVPALWRGSRLERPIFIVGAPRSGTSLLYAILRSSRALAHWPGEAHEVWEADYHPALRGWKSNVLTAEDIEPEAAARIRRAFFLTAGSRHRLIDKTPRNSLRLTFVDALFPTAQFVYLQRDGRDNVNSLINAWRTPRYRTYRLPEPHAIPGTDPLWWKFILYPGWENDVRGPLELVCARQWVAANQHASGAFELLDTTCWRALRYEDLVEDPIAQVEQVMAFLGLDLDAPVRRAAERISSTPINVVTPPERGKWRRENPREIEAILDLIQPTMETLGYELDEV